MQRKINITTEIDICDCEIGMYEYEFMGVTSIELTGEGQRVKIVGEHEDIRNMAKAILKHIRRVRNEKSNQQQVISNK